MTAYRQRQEILRNAAESGEIWELSYDGGPVWIRAGKVDLGDEKDRGSQALFVDELRAMVRDGLAERRGNGYCRLTGAGFTAAKRAVEMPNLEEVPTVLLADIIRHEAELWQKPDQAVWHELMVRFRWVGCPKEDRALISSLDSVLRPLNSGHTMLPPGIITLPGAGLPPPPPYYRGKVTLSQVANLPAVQTATPCVPEHRTVVMAGKSAENKTLDYQLWISGSFYLCALIFIMLSLLVVARSLSVWVLPLFVVAGLILFTAIGAFQLRNDGKIEEKGFLSLIKLSFQKIPLLGKLLPSKSGAARSRSAD